MAIPRERIDDLEGLKLNIKKTIGKIFIDEKLTIEEANFMLEAILVENYAMQRMGIKKMESRLNFMKDLFEPLWLQYE